MKKVFVAALVLTSVAFADSESSETPVQAHYIDIAPVCKSLTSTPSAEGTEGQVTYVFAALPSGTIGADLKQVGYAVVCAGDKVMSATAATLEKGAVLATDAVKLTGGAIIYVYEKAKDLSSDIGHALKNAWDNRTVAYPFEAEDSND